jgi:hypothetical protein
MDVENFASSLWYMHLSAKKRFAFNDASRETSDCG